MATGVAAPGWRSAVADAGHGAGAGVCAATPASATGGSQGGPACGRLPVCCGGQPACGLPWRADAGDAAATSALTSSFQPAAGACATGTTGTTGANGATGASCCTARFRPAVLGVSTNTQRLAGAFAVVFHPPIGVVADAAGLADHGVGVGSGQGGIQPGAAVLRVSVVVHETGAAALDDQAVQGQGRRAPAHAQHRVVVQPH